MLDRYTPVNIDDPKCFLVNGYKPINQTMCPVRMDAQFMDGDGYNQYNSTLYLTYGDYWIFDNKNLTELKTFIQSVTSFTLTYNVKVDYPDTSTLTTSCFDWNIVQKFDYTNRGIIKLTLNLEQMNCGYVSEFIDNPSTGINALIVFALAFISLVLAINYFFAIARMYRKIRERYIEKEKELRTRAESHQISFKKIALKNQKYIQTL